MSTPSKARKRQHGKNGWPSWLTRKRRPQASPTKLYTHPFSRELGRTIQAWRRAHRLKATVVADLAKLSRSALAKMERGEVWFSINMAMRVCDAMGLCIAAATFEALRRAGRLPR
ncbi:MAG: helix-turn-helix domain-containing protein [Chthoniobacter sp.]|nr:helix-turn-helix domain-containing protein [Chthoniobacter sp.]